MLRAILEFPFGKRRKGDASEKTSTVPETTPQDDAVDETVQKPDVEVNYSVRPSLFSNAEAAVLAHLRKEVGRFGHVSACVRISDVIKVSADGDWSAQRRAFNALSMKHVDFVVTTARGRMLFAVEVDDSSHRDPKTQARDALVNDVFAKAGLPLIRFAPGEERSHQKLAAQLSKLKPREEQAA